MAGLTPQQIAAIQAAAQAGVGAESQGTPLANLNSAMNNSLSGSGLFDPAELQAVNSTWAPTGTWQNGDQATGNAGAWDQQMTNAINGVLGSQQAVSANQQPQNPAVAAGYNPLQPSYLSQPATLNASTVDPSSLGSQQTVNALVSANQPQFQQQDQQMMQMLATAGLAPSSTAGGTAFNNLAQQQLAGMDPSIAAAIQNSQGNQLNAGEFNANSLNSAANTNLTNQLQQQLYNSQAYNNAGNTYFNAMTGAYNNNANAFNSLNNAGLSGAQGLASGQQQGGNQLAAGSQNTFPVYGSNSNAYGALGSALGGSASSGGYYGSASPQQGGLGFDGLGTTSGNNMDYFSSTPGAGAIAGDAGGG